MTRFERTADGCHDSYSGAEWYAERLPPVVRVKWSAAEWALFELSIWAQRVVYHADDLRHGRVSDAAVTAKRLKGAVAEVERRHANFVGSSK